MTTPPPRCRFKAPPGPSGRSEGGGATAAPANQNAAFSARNPNFAARVLALKKKKPEKKKAKKKKQKKQRERSGPGAIGREQNRERGSRPLTASERRIFGAKSQFSARFRRLLLCRFFRGGGGGGFWGPAGGIARRNAFPSTPPKMPRLRL